MDPFKDWYLLLSIQSPVLANHVDGDDPPTKNSTTQVRRLYAHFFRGFKGLRDVWVVGNWCFSPQEGYFEGWISQKPLLL